MSEKLSLDAMGTSVLIIISISAAGTLVCPSCGLLLTTLKGACVDGCGRAGCVGVGVGATVVWRSLAAESKRIRPTIKIPIAIAEMISSFFGVKKD